ncbi:MAG: hypothetical protein ACO3O3_11470 [Ilumatobacteraceae bacterium]
MNRERKEFIHPHMFGESCERSGLHEPASVFNFAVRYLMSPCMTQLEGMEYSGLWFDSRVTVATDRSPRLEVRDAVRDAFDSCVELDKVKLINEIALVSKPMAVRLRNTFKEVTPIIDPLFGMFDEDEINAVRWALWIDD